MAIAGAVGRDIGGVLCNQLRRRAQHCMTSWWWRWRCLAVVVGYEEKDNVIGLLIWQSQQRRVLRSDHPLELPSRRRLRTITSSTSSSSSPSFPPHPSCSSHPQNQPRQISACNHPHQSGNNSNRSTSFIEYCIGIVDLPARCPAVTPSPVAPYPPGPCGESSCVVSEQRRTGAAKHAFPPW